MTISTLSTPSTGPRLFAQVPQTSPVARDAGTAAPAGPPLPPLTPDAQRLVNQLKQDQASIVEQVRYLQMSYRDPGLLEDGELGFVRVTMTDGRASYAASEANGVKSQPYGPRQGSSRLERIR